MNKKLFCCGGVGMWRVCCLLIVLAISCATMASAISDDVVDSGSCGENVRWTLYEDGCLRFDGSGPMNESAYGAPWLNYDVRPIDVVISEGITTISAGALQRMYTENRDLKTVTIPSTVEYIGDDAFASCVNLSSVEILGRPRFGVRVFSRCGSLESINCTVDEFTQGLFSGCSNLRNVKSDVSSSSTIFGHGACKRCEHLEYMSLSEGIQMIDGMAFYGCSALKAVYLPASVESIKEYAFFDCFALGDIYYGGTETQWQKVNVENSYIEMMGVFSNGPLLNARVHYAVTRAEFEGITTGQGVAAVTEPSSSLSSSTSISPAPSPSPSSSPSPWAVSYMKMADEEALLTTMMAERPLSPINRGEAAKAFVALIERKLEKPIAEVVAMYGVKVAENVFEDTDDEAVLALYALGIAKGVGDGKFAPEQILTRAEAVTFLGRIMTQIFGVVTSGYASSFRDMKGYTWAEPYIGWMQSRGIVEGDGQGHFLPSLELTGEALAAINVRALMVLRESK